MQQVCVPTEPAEAAAGHAVQLSDRGGHGVEQVAFDPAAAQLFGIQLGRVGWQPLDLIVVRTGRLRAGRDNLQLRELTRFRWGLVDQIGDAKRRLLTILDRVFPEYETLFSDVFIKSSRALLQQATTAAEFAEADLDELTALLKQTSRGKLGQLRAEALQTAARESLGLSKLGGVAGFELRALLDQITFLEQQVAATEQQIEALLATLEQHVTDIKGIGPVLAASLVAEIGDIHRFPRLKSLVAYAGIDL